MSTDKADRPATSIRFIILSIASVRGVKRQCTRDGPGLLAGRSSAQPQIAPCCSGPAQAVQMKTIFGESRDVPGLSNRQ